MHTVIILNKHSSDLLQDFKFLFKPFLDRGIISFCDWNESGTDILTSVPDLYNLIKGKQEWRALILGTDSLCEQPPKYVPDEKNPFDFPSECSGEGIPKESNVPVIRLAHMICGYPMSTVKNFEKGFEFFDEELGGLRRIRESEITEDMMFQLSEKYGDRLKAIYMEEVVPEELKEAQQKLIDKYTFMDVRPREVMFISTRKHPMDEDDIFASWKTQLEMESSNFCARNKYPNNCRFMCYDITNAENSRYMRELVELWLSVLSVALNRIPASTLQAYRLYRLSVDISEKEMSTLLNGHLDKMEAVYQFVQDRMKMKSECSFEPEEELVEEQDIPVIFEGNSGRNLTINTGSVGLSRNCPKDEMMFWIQQVSEKQKNIEWYLKEPRRAIDRAAQHMKDKADSFYGDEYELDRFQVMDLEQEMERLEEQILACDTRGIIDDKKIKAEIKEIDKEVKKDIALRMDKATVIGVGLLALVAYFIGFVPYLYNAAMKSGEVFLSAFVVAIVAILVVSIGGVIALFVLRRRIVKSMERFNRAIKRMINNVNSASKKFGDYFSVVCSYMKAQSVYDGMRLKSDSMSSARFVLRAHKQALKLSIAQSQEFAASYGIKREAEAIRNVTSFFDETKLPRDNSLYYFEVNNVAEGIPLNDTGDYVTAPYRFIAKLNIEREDIFEDMKGEQ